MQTKSKVQSLTILLLLLLLGNTVVMAHQTDKFSTNTVEVGDSLSYSYGVIIATTLSKYQVGYLNKTQFLAGLEASSSDNAVLMNAAQEVSNQIKAINEGTASDTLSDSTSFFFGQLIGEEFFNFLGEKPQKAQLVDVAEGIVDQLSASAEIDINTAQGFLMAYQELQNEIWKDENASFLEEIGQKENITVTSTGLMYEVLTPSEGVSPADTNTVKVHYKGTLIDGTQFDSSYDRGEPIEFPLNQVIPGWTEGVQFMTVGSKFRFYIPYQLAYGERGNRGIPPFSTLIFEIELLGIK